MRRKSDNIGIRGRYTLLVTCGVTRVQAVDALWVKGFSMAYLWV